MYAELKQIRQAINYLAKVVETQNEYIKQINTRLSIVENRERRKTAALEKFEQAVEQLDRLVEELSYQIHYKDKAPQAQMLQKAIEHYYQLYQQAMDWQEREYYHQKITETKESLLALEGYDI